ncbi:hypothetical protein Tco_0736091, partial [Tanacetum coccineum]
MPTTVKTYDGTGDLKDHLKTFTTAAKVESSLPPAEKVHQRPSRDAPCEAKGRRIHRSFHGTLHQRKLDVQGCPEIDENLWIHARHNSPRLRFVIINVASSSWCSCNKSVEGIAAYVTYSHGIALRQEYLLEFTSEYSISEDLHPELPAPGYRIVDFPEDKIGVYTKFFEFANFRIPISQLLFDILGYYQIHLSQLSVIGASKPLDSLKNWNNRFFWVDEKVFPTVVDWRESAPKDEKPAEGSYSVEDVARLDTRRTPIQKQPEALLCLVGLSRRYYLGDDVYPTFLYDDGREMDLFNLISAPNLAKVKTGTLIDMGELAAATESFGTPSTIERSPLDFNNENPSQQINRGDETEDQVLEAGPPEVPLTRHAPTTGVAPNIVIEEEDAAYVPLVSKRCRKRVNDEAEANAPPKVLRKDFDVSRPAPSTFGGKSFALTGLEASSILSAPASQGTPT